MPRKIEETNEEEMKALPYRHAIGKLMYAMIGTRLDIAYAVSKMSQFMTNYGKQHWTAVKRIFRYLNSTKEYYLKLSGTHLIGYSDSDWAGDKDDRKSTSLQKVREKMKIRYDAHHRKVEKFEPGEQVYVRASNKPGAGQDMYSS